MIMRGNRALPLALALAASWSIISQARQITIHNNCRFTIWPAVHSGISSQEKPDGVAANGGWELGAGESSTFNVPDNWTAARIWARQECDFQKPDVESCVTGSCIGGLGCRLSGIPPATLAQMTLNPKGDDFYAISIVDGINLPMSIKADGCPTALCPLDLRPKVRVINDRPLTLGIGSLECPEALRVKNQDARTIACLSACQKFGGEANCCTGSKNLPSTCPSSGVDYYEYFKSRCSHSYVYAYDEPSDTALWTCRGGPSYNITFCPIQEQALGRVQ